MAALGTAAFCFVTTENLPIGLMPLISAGLHSSLSAVGLLVTAYALVVVGVSAPLTHMTAKIPRRLLVCALLGAFIVASLAAAAAQSYWWLLSARVFTAMAQALFWAVSTVTAAGLFPPRVRAKAVAGVMVGGSLGVVLGVPAGTWIGQQGGWRLPFVVLSGIAALSLTAVAFLLPTVPPSESHASRGAEPDRRHFYFLMATTVLVVSGFFTVYTYITTLLTRTAGIAAHDVPPVLLVGGVASAIGVASTGMLFDRRPRAFSIAPVVLLAVGLLGLWALRTSPMAAVAMLALANLGLGCFVIANQSQVLIVAPGNSDVASAWSSASFNVGIGAGSLLGGLVLPSFGPPGTALTGGLLASAALAVALANQAGGSGARLRA